MSGVICNVCDGDFTECPTCRDKVRGRTYFDPQLEWEARTRDHRTLVENRLEQIVRILGEMLELAARTSERARHSDESSSDESSSE